MLDIAADLLPILDGGEPVAAVTVTRVIDSAPRGPGATLAVTADLRVIGSISGGCVEGDAVMLGLETLRDGVPRTRRFGFGDDAGQACRGAIEVLAYRVTADAAVGTELAAAAAGREARLGVVVAGPDAGRILADGYALPEGHVGGARILDSAYDGCDVLELAVAGRPRLLILGAGEHAAALCRVASAAGFAVTVCDAWGMLVTAERFPDAVDLVIAAPHEYLAEVGATLDERTAICVLTHDERLDVPAIRAALELPIGFVGAMGARSTVARRAALLRDAGVGGEALRRLHSPLGLDLGGRSPDETAVSVVAEIIAARHRGSAEPLRQGAGPIHRGTPADPAAGSVHAASCGVPDALRG